MLHLRVDVFDLDRGLIHENADREGQTAHQEHAPVVDRAEAHHGDGVGLHGVGEAGPRAGIAAVDEGESLQERRGVERVPLGRPGRIRCLRSIKRWP